MLDYGIKCTCCGFTNVFQYLTCHTVAQAIIVTQVTAVIKSQDHDLFCQVTTPGNHCAWVTPGTVESNKQLIKLKNYIFCHGLYLIYWILQDFYCVMDYVISIESIDCVHLICDAWWPSSCPIKVEIPASHLLSSLPWLQPHCNCWGNKC